MGYKVLDEKGVAFSDDGGRKVIPCGAMLDDSLVENGLFTKGCIELLIKRGRIEGKIQKQPLQKTPQQGATPLASPANKKAKVPKGKGGKK